jgi:hypothetical protein
MHEKVGVMLLGGFFEEVEVIWHRVSDLAKFITIISIKVIVFFHLYNVPNRLWYSVEFWLKS